MAAPPPPPPPPSLLCSSPILSSSWRSSTNSNRQTRTSVSPTSKPTTSRLDPTTLQHAAACLRKTEHNRSVRYDLEDLSNGRVDRSNQELSGRHWQNHEVNEQLARNQARTTVHASPAYTRDSLPFGNIYQHTNPLNSQTTAERSHNSYSSHYLSEQPSSNYKSVNNNSSSPSSYITNPKSYIHAYATQTPAHTLATEPSMTNNLNNLRSHSTPFNSNYNTMESSTTTINAPQNMDNYKFTKELRDQGLTKTQRIANQFQQSHIRNASPPRSMRTLYKQKQQLGGDQIDSLIRDMEWRMTTKTGAAGDKNCCKCGVGISNERPGCTALEQMFHIDCFSCKECGKQLAGGSFYNVDGKPLCETDYVNTLERCSCCGQPIMEKLLRASGQTYHPNCFLCTQCNKCLDGVPFTVDANNKIHCVTCFHEKFAPRCAVCAKSIVPDEGEKESVRVVAMDKSFHVDCYRCEDCNMQLSSKIEGQGCYPLDQHLYCKNCNGKRLIALSQAA